ncbi:hypothetical protein K469DRAFT_571958 [Zopfia rhizophila CBS 207.26]|uniref:Rhodopsin domain-containing protein n=1 Tax=Zopfia rhizophila CBS 207.26 TaxID=1314779 RepID=A0A6A6E3E8_9PEZI|nr:hypothetical protein K469DRAFT_571958 [Zopfia rhizophila CBS 207.26]
MAMSILEPEAGIWYTLCWIVLLARLVGKRLRFGSWSSLQVDDGLILLAMVTMTIVVAFLHIIIHTNSNLIPPGEDVSKFTPEDIKERIYGSKLTIVVEQMSISTIWLIKTCLLIMYGRMTDLLPQHKIVKVVAVYVALGWLLMEILWFGVWCRPFNQYWAVPTNSIQCSAMINHLITNAVLNISSDIMIMLIPIPLVFKVKMPLKKKIVLSCIFLIGTFVVFAAAKNKYESFTSPFSVDWVIWYLREMFTAMLCANLPLTRPVVQRVFGIEGWTQPSSVSARYGQSSRTRSSSYRLRQHSTTITSNSTKSKYPNAVARSASEEHINQHTSPLEVLYETEVRVERAPADGFVGASVIEMGRNKELPERPSDSDSIETESTSSKKARSLHTTCYHESTEEMRRA